MACSKTVAARALKLTQTMDALEKSLPVSIIQSCDECLLIQASALRGTLHTLQFACSLHARQQGISTEPTKCRPRTERLLC